MCIVKLDVMLAHKWDEDSKVDPTDWLVSEKLDGVRSVWTGSHFISRNGKPFYAPDYFKAVLPPDTILDGELFGGRGEFQKTVGIVKSITTRKDEWEGLTFMIFDAPQVPGTFEERYQFLLRMMESSPETKYMKVVEQTPCEGKAQLMAGLVKMQDNGGEGLMLRQPGSLYESGRTRTLLKVKSFQDTDGVVIGLKEGKGRLKGVMGALLCSLRDDPKKTFSVGTGFTDEQRKAPPENGTVVIVKYQEMTKAGIPRFPVYIGVRAD